VPYFISILSNSYNAHRESSIFTFQIANLVVRETTFYAKIVSAVQIKLVLDLQYSGITDNIIRIDAI
jgi:hypothetical protein